MFKFFANLFGYVLNFIYGIVNNYGLSIIIFTIILKLLMLPISISQQKTMKKSAKIQEETKKIQEKYKGDQVKINQEVMDLYKKENMSPFSGCLSSIIQIILIIAMFYLVSKPLTYMKHIDQDTLNGYIQEIVAEQGNTVRYQEIAVIREKANVDENVNLNMEFLGLNLCAVPIQDYNDWKVFIIPALYVATSIISTKMTQNATKSKKKKENIVEDNQTKDLVKKEDSAEDMANEMSQTMTAMMPVMTVSIAIIAPLGLALYWFVNNLIMMAERKIIDNIFKDEE